jgi:ribosomal protein S7
MKQSIQIKKKYNFTQIKYFAKKFYLRLLHHLIKKGNKYKIEVMFKALSLFIVKLRPFKNSKFKYRFSYLILSFIFTLPSIIVKTKRKGSKHIYMPVPITLKRRLYFSSKWLELSAKTRINKKFYKNLAEEIFATSLQKSLSIKKCLDMHKLAVANKANIKRFKKKKKWN